MRLKDSTGGVTLAAVARKAGVSAMTVSRALRNDPRQLPSTNRRIQRVAHQMGYRPNPLVSVLVSHIRHSRQSPHRATVGVLAFGDPEDAKRFPTIRRFRAGIMARGSSLGFDMEEFYLHDPAISVGRWKQIFVARGVAGLIILPMPNHHAQLAFDLAPFACATVGYTLEHPAIHRAAHHHFQGMCIALAELSARGFHRIGFVDNSYIEERVMRLWLSAYLSHDLHPGFPICRLAGGDTMERQARDLSRWIQRFKPDALVTNIPYLPSILKQIGGKFLPGMPVASLDVSADDQTTAGIDQKSELVGAAAFDLVLGQLHRNERGIPDEPKIIMTSGKWVDGEIGAALKSRRSK